TRTLERIFIEERIYKRIEQKKTQEAVQEAVLTGFEPYRDQLLRDVSDEDVEHLLKIPIRRISLFDIEKNKSEIEEINANIKQVEYDLGHLTDYAIRTLKALKSELNADEHSRKTVIADFNTVNAREVAKRELDLRYDEETGYLGTEVRGGVLIDKVSEYDKILVIQKNGAYFCINVSERTLIGKEAAYIGLADKELLEDVVFTVIYQSKDTGRTGIKRTKLNTGFILNKSYELLPDPQNDVMRKLSTLPNAEVTITFKGSGRFNEQTFLFSDYRVKGAKAGGVMLTKREIASIKIKPAKLVEEPEMETASESLKRSFAESEQKQVEEKQEPPVLKEKKAKSRDEEEPSLFD
ncbi:MAG: DNA topoisomerase IV subunit A, partial [Sphaerochaetaceae bacterium]|nr:DNA topoisomerase IV subunit A [Sphaerochaetaceae bacterium]